MPIRIISVGKKHEAWVSEGIERYQKRLKKPFDVEWVLLSHSSLHDTAARQDESKRIISRLNEGDYVVLLDEKGKIINSTDLSSRLSAILEISQQIVVIIGGAYGVNSDLVDRANFIWSLSHLVFPHQLVRLILTEQIYRSQEIAGGKPYHHK